MNFPAISSTRMIAVATGICYVLIFILSITTNFFIFDKILVTNNVVASLQNIQIHHNLFRFGIALWILVLICDTIVAWTLLCLFYQTHKHLSILSASLRFLFVGIFACSLLPYFGLLELSTDLTNSSAIAVLGKTLLTTAFYGVRVSYVFFGLHILTVGLLVLQSALFHKFAGVLLLIASIGYLLDSFLNFISYAYSKSEYGFILVVGLPALIAELTLTLELLFVVGNTKSKAQPATNS